MLKRNVTNCKMSKFNTKHMDRFFLSNYYFKKANKPLKYNARVIMKRFDDLFKFDSSDILTPIIRTIRTKIYKEQCKKFKFFRRK
jgi:hypothetical protein